MLAPGGPKFRRRKAERPAEIVDAALQVFSEKGFAAARLDDIARRAGVSKGALYLYFETKEDLFRAVVGQLIAPNLQLVFRMIAAHPGPFPDLLEAIAERISAFAGAVPVGGIVKMVIGEAGNFPELARVWHDDLVAHAVGALSQAIRAAQARGEVVEGDARIYAMQIVAPILLSVVWREVFAPVGGQPFDIASVARQHAATMVRGLSPDGPSPRDLA